VVVIRGTIVDQQRLISEVAAHLEADPRIRALFLSGSFGKGTADAWSDVDLLAVVPAEQHEALAADWRKTLETIVPIVHFNRLPWALVLNAVTDGWLRIDLDVTAPDRLQGRAQDKLKALIDRDNIYAALPATIPDPGPDPRRMAGTISEFIRILGLSHVADGRGEYELAVLGYSMLRRMMSDILVAEMGIGDTGGALHLSKLIDPGRMKILTDLPSPLATRDSVLAANNAVARVFFPRAKALAAKLGIDWPQAFEDATRAVLTSTLPEAHRPDW
jgi:predicted nucleotidyltransferase